MPGYQVSDESQRDHQYNVNLRAVYTSLVGTIVLVIGIVMGVFVATTAFDLLDGNDPHRMIDRVVAPAKDQIAGVAERNNWTVVEFSPDLKQVLLYVLAFLFLALPLSLATTLITAGAKMLHGDAAEAVTQIAKSLKK